MVKVITSNFMNLAFKEQCYLEITKGSLQKKKKMTFAAPHVLVWQNFTIALKRVTFMHGHQQ